MMKTTLPYIGITLYPFGLFVALGALSGCLMLLWLSRIYRWRQK